MELSQEEKDTLTKIEQLREYLINSISPIDLAIIIRRFQNEALKMYLDLETEKTAIYDKDWITQGNHFLTELVEILDPNITKDIG